MPASFQFYFTKNPRKDELLKKDEETKEQHCQRIAKLAGGMIDPIINDIVCPPDLGAGDEGLKEYFEKHGYR